MKGIDEIVYVDGKALRRGYTTGSSATAATRAAVIGLFSGRRVDEVEIITPKDITLKIPVKSVEIGSLGSFAKAVVLKDGGDDIDATHGMEIVSKVSLVGLDYSTDYSSLVEDERMILTAGEGIGRVTEKGLRVEVGRPAINPTPVSMIEGTLWSTIDELGIDKDIFQNNKILVEISAPDGYEISKRTFNPNLGIVGGISILGTTGIVEPMSEESWKESISIEMNMKKEKGYSTIILAPGNIGVEKVCTSFGYSEDMVVKMSNFIGHVLMEAKRLDFDKIVIAGHIGKLIKLSAGITNTHSRIADARVEIMISNLALMGASIDVLKDIENTLTTDAMIPIIKENQLTEVFDILAKKARKRAIDYMRDDKSRDVEIYLFAMNGELLGYATE